MKSNYVPVQHISKSYFINYNPLSIATKNAPNSQIQISIPRERFCISLQHSYIVAFFEVFKNDDTINADNDEIRFVNLGQVALFSESKLLTFSGKHLENVNDLHTLTYMNKLPTTSVNRTEIMYGFGTQAQRPALLITNNTEKGTVFLGRKLGDLFGFADQKE